MELSPLGRELLLSDVSSPLEKAQHGASRCLSAVWVHALILVILGIVAFAGSWRNEALLHHAPSPVVPALVDDGMLQGTRHFSRIFTRDFLMRTPRPGGESGARGEYRPLGYAVFALARGMLRGDAAASWHIFFLLLHLATALLLYLLLRSLAGGGLALGLSALYVCHPIFLSIINDPNMIYINVGLAGSALTLLWVRLFLKRGNAGYLLLAVGAFVASLLTFRPALALPAFVAVLCLMGEKHPRAAAAALLWLALAALAGMLYNLPPWLVGLGLTAAATMVGMGAQCGRAAWRRCAQVLPLFLVLGAGMFLAIETVHPASRSVLIINDILGKSRLFVPSLAQFSGLALLRMNGYVRAALVLMTLAPLALFLKPRLASVIFVVFAAAFLVVTIPGNSLYRTDSGYWESVLEATPNDNGPVQYHLAAACCADEKWTEARELLMCMKYVSPPDSGLTRDLVTILLSKVFYALGNEKVATSYCFSPTQESPEASFTKAWLMGRAEAAMQLGFLSSAESDWARASAEDPYDLDLYNKLGMVLIYKNFPGAAKTHFAYVLSLDPHNETALYYRAFIAKQDKDDQAFERFQAAWQKSAKTNAEIDFKPIYERRAASGVTVER